MGFLRANDKETFEGNEIVHLLGVGPTTNIDNVSQRRTIWGSGGFYYPNVQSELLFKNDNFELNALLIKDI